MTFTSNLHQYVENYPLKTFKWFQRFFAIFLIAIPVILRLTDKYCDGTINNWRSSISDYVYMNHSYVFGMLLTMASMLFIINGVIYFRNEIHKDFDLEKSGKWYNILLGISLIGVIIFPYKEFPVVHYSFAATFFGGNAIVTAFFHTKKDRVQNIILAILTVIALALFFTKIFSWLTLFWAEWVSVVAVGLHFFLEAKRTN